LNKRSGQREGGREKSTLKEAPRERRKENIHAAQKSVPEKEERNPKTQNPQAGRNIARGLTLIF